MPFDERFTHALNALAPECSAFRSALASTLEEVRGMVVKGTHADSPDRHAAELGAFAQGRIQADRFAEIANSDAHYKKTMLSSIRQAQQILAATLALGDQLHFVHVPEGGDLPQAIEEALAMAGRAFSAAYAIELMRSGRIGRIKDETLLGPLPPAKWTRAERLVAPPLVARVSGNDLQIAGFDDLLQGSQKIVLLVDGHAPPALLARLITPAVFVMQCRSLADLTRLREAQAPGIAAVMSEPVATFTWDRGRLAITELPQEPPRRPLRTSTVFRQREDLAWLLQLQKLNAAVEHDVAVPQPEAAEPGDKLAAWLLRQVELPDP